MFNDKTVLVTGASSGIGAALARRFAEDGARLLLMARREDRLRSLEEELRAANGKVEAHVIASDLVGDGACERVVEQAIGLAGRIDVLINNAGVGEYGTFAEKDLAATDRMMRLNMSALVRLTHRVLPQMLERRSGWIMNIASAAGFQPTPYMGVYGATKSFVLSFSLSLWEELRHRGIVVTCVCPGPVKTEFFHHGGFESRIEDFTKLAAEADWVAEKAYRALVRRKAVLVPDRLSRMSLLLQRLMPIRFVTRLAGKVLGPIEQ